MSNNANMKEGLNQPPINDLEKKAGCRYLLVSAVSRRARQLMDENLRRDDKSASMRISDNEALDEAIEEFFNDEYKVVQTGGQQD